MSGSTFPPEEQTRRVSYLLSRGVDPKAAATAAQSKKTYDQLCEALSAARISSHSSSNGFSPDSPEGKRAAALVYSAILKLNDKKAISKGGIPDQARALLFTTIGDGRISGNVHLEAAVSWLLDKYAGTNSLSKSTENEESTQSCEIDVAEFERHAGVGIVVRDEDVLAAIDAAIEEQKDEILERRYRFNSGLILRPVMDRFKFVEGKFVRDALNDKLAAILGPKSEADMATPSKAKKVKHAGGAAPQIKAPRGKDHATSELGCNEKSTGGIGLVPLGVPTENSEDPFAGIPTSFHARDLKSAQNSPDLLERQQAATGGKIVCRFPPEPNGYLHVGHAKAMFLDFGFAKKTGGETILRFDDTNPVAEKDEYTASIIDIVNWMGHCPSRITYSSDYFNELYELAVKLIKLGKAYVCHQTGEEMKKGREQMIESPYRNRPTEENLTCFENMRRGYFGEGEAVLRMKIDMKSANPVMRDPVAYRVLHNPHARTGDKWCVYPSYDYTHCIVDSLEWITHSLCTLEFEIRRDSYYWLLEALGLYRPFVWEFARLSLEYTVMSKRKLKELVERGIVRGWDDPRMPTLSGMRRRGYPACAINRFCTAIGASRASNMIGLHVLEYWVRNELDRTCARAFAVLHPLKVVILNFRGPETVRASKHPKNPEMGTRDLSLTNIVFIESSDFRMQDEKNYFGLAPGKTAMLRYAYPITVKEVVTSESSSEVSELHVVMDYNKSVKPKGVLHWAPETASRAEVRIISTLFKSADPGSLEKSEWIDDVNLESMSIVRNVLVEDSVKNASVRDSFQFERTGYFTCDDDSSPAHPVFNLIVSLRDSR